MAALICKGFGDFCSGVCKLARKLVGVLPFRLLCNCNNPFAIYVVTALGFNIPAIATGLSVIITDGLNLEGCKMYMWLLVNTIFCFTNIAGAVYIAYKFQKPSNPETARQSGINRASYILCHDPGVAIYILSLIGFFVWLCIGLTWDDGCGDIHVPSLIGIGFSFLGVGFMAIMISLCCSCCCQGGYGQDNNVYHIPNQNNSANHPAASQSQPYQNNNDVETSEVAVPIATPVVAEVIPAASVAVKPEPSAPPLPTAGTSGDNMKTKAKAAAAAGIGMSLGGKIGEAFGASDKTETKLEKGGAKTSVAVNNAFEGMKKMAGKK